MGANDSFSMYGPLIFTYGVDTPLLRKASKMAELSLSAWVAVPS